MSRNGRYHTTSSYSVRVMVQGREFFLTERVGARILAPERRKNFAPPGKRTT